jgi:hypothetical protein
LPEDLFALTLRVIVRRIKEVDAAVNRGLDQFIGPCLTNGLMPLKSPEFRKKETHIAERCVFHDALPIVEYPRFAEV